MPEKAQWVPQTSLKQVATKYANTFSEDELIIHPNRIECNHPAEHAGIIGSAYAAMGYFGFVQRGFIVLARAEDVLISTPQGARREPIRDLLLEE